MNFEHLRIFILTSDLHSMKQAAEVLFVTPQYISKSIKKLESQFKFPLFTRTHYGVELTKEGELIYPYLRDIYERVLHLEDIIPQLLQNSDTMSLPQPSLNLSIACGADFSTFLINALPALSYKYDSLCPEIITKESNDILQHLDESSYDIVLCNAPNSFLEYYENELSKYSYLELSISKLYLFIDKFSPLSLKKSITPKEIAKLPLAFYRSSNDIDPLFFEMLYDQDVDPKTFFTSSSPQLCSSYSYKANLYQIGTDILKMLKEKRNENFIAIPISGVPAVKQIFFINKNLKNENIANDLFTLIKQSILLSKSSK